jgi:fructokinase
MASHIRIGIDVGGTKIEGVALDRDEELARLRIATPQHDYDATVQAIVGWCTIWSGAKAGFAATGSRRPWGSASRGRLCRRLGW